MSEKKHRPFTPFQVTVGRAAIRVMSALNIWVYRLSGGKIGGRFRGGAPVLLLTATGRKSGKPRTSPLLYLESGDDVVVVGSQAGMPRHPVWYLNLEANPEVEIEIGRERRKMLARRASPDEKKELWPGLVAMYPDYDDYQKRTERDIPVVILARR